jgi:hypothetical protein
MQQVTLQLTEEDATDDRLDTLTGYLQQELLQLDVEDVRRPPAAPAPPGTRAVDLAQIGSIVVLLEPAAAGLKEIIAVIRGWLSRGDGVQRGVKIQLDGDVLELTNVSAAEQDRLITVFTERHRGR